MATWPANSTVTSGVVTAVPVVRARRHRTFRAGPYSPRACCAPRKPASPRLGAAVGSLHHLRPGLDGGVQGVGTAGDQGGAESVRPAMMPVGFVSPGPESAGQ